MGKTSKWFRSLLGSKKSPARSSAAPPDKEKKQSKSKNGDPFESPYVDGLDANKHAIAVAAATAAVAEAALAAAQAAAEVVRLTSGGGSGSGRNVPSCVRSERRRVSAAIKIQSAFRSYLARRALRALKGLVKLQALVRGHIVRRQSADMLRRMQAMARIQARASSNRSYVSNANIKFSNLHHPSVMSSRNYSGSSLKRQCNPRVNTGNTMKKESSRLPYNWLDSWMEQCTWNNIHNTSLDPNHVEDDRTDRVLEVDTWKPHQTARRSDKTCPTSQHEYSRTGSISRFSRKLQKPNPSVSSEEVSSLRSPNFPPDGDQVAVWTAENSPRMQSRRGLFVPTGTDCSRSLFGDYLSHPSYMANTESSRAKFRSQSAPKQRMELEELGISSSFGRNMWESDATSEKGFVLPGSTYQGDARLNPGYLKRQGTPARGVSNGFSTTYGYRL